MKKIIFSWTLILFLSLGCAWAESAKIIDLEGQVFLKNTPKSQWAAARLNDEVNGASEIKTQKGAYCTISFDAARKNLVTIKENSSIRVDSIKPGRIFLPKGRVLSLIRQASRNQVFEVRTPTAVAGARGTGWLTDSDGTQTQAQCFENMIFVQGLDEDGNVTDETDLEEGMGLNVSRGGGLGQSRPLDESDFNEWNDFSGYAQDVSSGGSGQGGDNNPINTPGGLQDLRDDQRNDLRGNFLEENRKGEITDIKDEEGGGYLVEE